MEITAKFIGLIFGLITLSGLVYALIWGETRRLIMMMSGSMLVVGVTDTYLGSWWAIPFLFLSGYYLYWSLEEES